MYECSLLQRAPSLLDSRGAKWQACLPHMCQSHYTVVVTTGTVCIRHLPGLKPS